MNDDAHEILQDRVSRIAERESPGLLAYFARRTALVEDAGDLLNETLLVLWRRADSLPVDDHEARLWAFGVARRVLSTHRRTQDRRHVLVERVREELAVRVSDDLDLEHVRAAVGSLRPIDREIVRLVHWDGFKLHEVARLLDRREATVRSRYFRARQRLRLQLGESAT